MRYPKTQTEEFLYHVSSHIHNRPQLRKITITVVISDDDMYIEPHFSVFPNRHHRKQSDAEDVLTHVLKRHMGQEEDIQLVPGTYVYQQLWNSNRRRWGRR